MTVEEVRERVEYIRSIRGDDEHAHIKEDSLHVAVLEAIANGEASDPAAIAKAALATNEIEFARWCA